MERVPPALAEAFETLHSAVHSFVPCSSTGVEPAGPFAEQAISLHFNPLLKASVTRIGDSLFPEMTEDVSETFFKNLGVWPPPSTKWAMHPNDLRAAHRNRNFVPEGWPVELVGPPAPAEGGGLTDQKVNPICCGLRCAAVAISVQTVAPADLPRTSSQPKKMVQVKGGNWQICTYFCENKCN